MEPSGEKCGPISMPGAGDQALGIAARAADDPDVSTIGKSDLSLAERRTLEKQRAGIRRPRRTESQNDEETYPEDATHKHSTQ